MLLSLQLLQLDTVMAEAFGECHSSIVHRFQRSSFGQKNVVSLSSVLMSKNSDKVYCHIIISEGNGKVEKGRGFAFEVD